MGAKVVKLVTKTTPKTMTSETKTKIKRDRRSTDPILPAAEVLKQMKAQQDKLTAERREFLRAQALLEDYADLRDDVISAVKNSGLSYEDIHGRCGPTPGTLEAWAEKRIIQPRLGKLRSTLRILGKDLGIVERKVARLGDEGAA